MSALIPFVFEGHHIRVVVGDDGEPLFVGKDVADALGYVNSSKAMGDHCKGVTKRYPLQTAGGMQELRVLAEADVLRLIVSSTLPAAQAFERWVFEDVLPSIRKTGSFSTPATAPQVALPPEHQALVALLYESAAIKANQAALAQAQAEQAEAQVQQASALAQVDQRVTDMADSMLMLARPAGAESIVHIRARINELHGLPVRIIDEVLRQSPIAPKPAGMVKHSREEAHGASYAVYWVKDISAMFKRFVGECERTTPQRAKHPFIEGDFKLAPGWAQGEG